MPSSKLIERAAECLGDDLTKLQQLSASVAEKLIADSGKLAKRTRYRLRNGASGAVDLQEKVVASIGTRPFAYLLVSLGLAAAVFLKIAADRHRNGGREE